MFDRVLGLLSKSLDMHGLPQILHIDVPTLDEIGVKDIYDEVVQRPGMAKYFPAKIAKGGSTDQA